MLQEAKERPPAHANPQQELQWGDPDLSTGCVEECPSLRQLTNLSHVLAQKTCRDILWLTCLIRAMAFLSESPASTALLSLSLSPSPSEAESPLSSPVECHDSTILFLFMPTFFFLVYFTLSHVTLLSHGSHVQSHDHGLFILRT